MENTLIPAVEKNFTLSKLTVNFRLDNIILTDALYDPAASQLSIHEAKPNFDIELVNCSFGIGFNYSIQTTPALINDVGFGKAWLNDMNIVFKGSPKAKDDFFVIDFDQIHVQLADFGLEVEGGDLAVIADFFDEFIQTFIQDYLVGQVNNQTQAVFEQAVNTQLLKVPTEATFDNGQVAIDYALVNEGIVVTDTYFALVMDGTVYLTNTTEPAQKAKSYSTMPAHETDGAEVQLLVSEYSLNSMLLTAVELNLLNYTNSDQNSASIEMLMNNFEGTYGVHENVTIVVNSAQENFQKYTPSIEVASGGSVITFYLDLHVKNPLNPSEDAAVLLVETKANVSFSVDGTLTLSGEVRSLDLSVVTFTPYF